MELFISFLTLTLLEIVLGIDNLIFISILSSKLPKHQQSSARKVGLVLALGFRILLLFFISWIAGLTENLFTIFGKGFSGRDIILLGGGMFLIAKSTTEIHEKVEGDEAGPHDFKSPVNFISIIFQIGLLDIVFSLDSVITAVGMSQNLTVMVSAVIAAVIVMVLTVNQLNDFINRNPTIKMLALSFLLMVGFVLVAEGWGLHVPKGYIYFAMAFSMLVEFLNIRARRKSKNV
ncbi:MAG: TerC family protein [Xanthomonadaceae bacterium]|nr:TerC family protein [Xanthomonadaceae bacterium]